MKMTVAVPILLCFCIGVCSCAVRRTAVRDTVEVTESEAGGEEENILFAEAGKYNGMLGSLEGEAMIVYRDPKRTLSFRSEVVAWGDASFLRLDLNEFVFKTPLATILKRRDEIYMYVHPEKSYIVTPVDEADFGTLLGFEVPVRFLFHTLLGRVYMPKESPRARMIDERHLEITAPDEEEIVRFGPELLPEGIEYRSKEIGEIGDIYRVSFDKYETSEGQPFPMVIIVKSGEKSLEIRYLRVSVNKEIGEAAFTPEDADFTGYTNKN
ncbi:MAG: DUF4292 domain-containing protein [Spirochaetes bacterium]|nr:DUF4292 domain-containing protein [Spirochaetota bacterium]